MKIILGSTSRDRKVCFEKANIEFETINSEYDETIIMELDPQILVQKLALGKAINVVSKWNQNGSKSDEKAIIICADTLVAYNNEIIGKPKNKNDAFRIISLLSGTIHDIFTGVAIIQSDTLQQEIFVEKSIIHFQKLAEDEIWNYLNSSDEYIGRSGAYSLRDQASLFIDCIQGSPTNVIGIPMAKLRLVLKKKFRINLLNFPSE